MRRFEAHPEIKKIELIEGKVHRFPPLSAVSHGKPDGLLHIWLGYYSIQVPGLEFFPNTTILLDGDNTPQPDCILCTTPRRGHHVWFDEKGYLCGRPELICEVAASSASIDLHDKMNVFRRHRIPEYLVWIVGEERVCWFELKDERYVEKTPRSGVLVSDVFPKLALDVKALLKHDGAKILAMLQKHLAR